jgi:carbon-monoxide dehydrogenase small subunit
MLAEGFLAERPEAVKEEIREVVSANLCRCTGYQTIVEAIDDCARRRRGEPRTCRSAEASAEVSAGAGAEGGESR